MWDAKEKMLSTESPQNREIEKMQPCNSDVRGMSQAFLK